MIPANLNAASSQQRAVSHEAVLAWLCEARAAIAGHPSEALLFDHGVDAYDVLLSELSLAMLATLRQGKTSAPSARARTLEYLRGRLYRSKMRLRESFASRGTVPPQETDILHWPRDITHVGVLVQVAQALQAQGMRSQFLACQPGTLQYLRESSTDAIFAPKAWPTAVNRARHEGDLRARELTHATAWELPDFGDLPGRDFEATLRNAIAVSLPTVFASLAITREALQATQARVLVVGNDLTLEGRAACLYAAQEKRSTAVFMHGTITGIPMQTKHLADRVFVYGDIHRRELLDCGMPAGQVEVCGDPKLDTIALQTRQTHPLLKQRFGIRDGQPWILAATSGPGHRVSHQHHEKVVSNLLALAEAYPEVPLLIKLHRKDRLEYYHSILSTSSAPHLHVIKYGEAGLPRDIFEWLQGCSLVLTGASTTAIEAMVMEVPVITMDFDNELYKIDFIDAGATVHAKNLAELKAAVGQVLATGRLPEDTQVRMQEFLRGTYFSLDRKSSERAARSLSELATKKQ